MRQEKEIITRLLEHLPLAAPIARKLPDDFKSFKLRDDVFIISSMLAYEYNWDEESWFGVLFCFCKIMIYSMRSLRWF